MAELLRVKGGDPHRARAFDRAAKVIGGLPEPVTRLVAQGRLDRMPGVGEGTVHRVKQILRRGTTDDLERLRRQVPPGLVEMVKIKGLGPRTVRMLYQRLRITTLESLEAAARSGKLLDLPRFGPDAVHGILREIEHYKNRRGKVPLVEALRMADEVSEWMRGEPAVLEIVPGGSARRFKALVGDFDYLASTDDPKAAVERFIRQPGAVAIVSQGAEEASVRLASGRQADLWVFPPESWGAGLHAFSGSKGHVRALRERAGRMGLHVSEHGVFTRDRSRRLTTGRREEEIFAAVGLPYITPELRQHLGEMDLAEEGRLPVLVREEDLRGDLHMHTTESDGKGTAREMVLAALELGYEYVAITDHSKGLTVANGLDERRLLAQGEALRTLEAEIARIHVLPGIEVDIHPDGSLDLEASALRRLEWVVASVHDHFDLDREAQTRRLVRAMETGLVDVVGHPTGRRLDRREPYPLDLDRVLDAARRLGVAVEVDGHPYRMDLDEVGCRQAREMGVPVVVDTDAHSPSELSRRLFGLAMARRGWLEKRHVLNTKPVEAIRDHRASRLRRQGLAVSVPEPRVDLEGKPSDDERAPEPAPSVEPAETGAADDAAVAALVEELGVETLSDELRERLQRYLESGDDVELESALRHLGPNPVQGAFNLLMKASG